MDKGSQRLTPDGKPQGFPEWSPEETEVQEAARFEVTQIPNFPDLERQLISVFGASPEAIVLHQLIYWFGKPKMAGRWTAYLTYAEWHDQRGLTRRQVYKARQRLKPTGIVAETKGPYKRVHYRLDWVRLLEVLHTGRLYPLNPVQPVTVPSKGRTVATVPPKGGSVPTAPPTSGYKPGENPHVNGENGQLDQRNGEYSPTQEHTQERSSIAFETKNSGLQPAATTKKTVAQPGEGKASISSLRADSPELGELRQFIEEVRRYAPETTEEELLGSVMKALIPDLPTAERYLRVVLGEDAPDQHGDSCFCDDCLYATLDDLPF